jgi:hypothetical protein
MTTDRSLKKITDVLSIACHVPICDVCVLHHNDNSFKAYVHGTTWYGQHVYDVIVNTWNIDEKNILIEPSPNAWWTFGSTGYVIEVKY